MCTPLLMLGALLGTQSKLVRVGGGEGRLKGAYGSRGGVWWVWGQCWQDRGGSVGYAGVDHPGVWESGG